MNKEIENIFIDDSVWGFPLGGIVLGYFNDKSKTFDTEKVPVIYFQSPKFENHEYLEAVGIAVLKMFIRNNVSNEAKIHVCRGYVNNGVPDVLIKNGYKNIQRVVIGEPLQSYLETKAKEYIASLGYDGYYDPKDLQKDKIGMEFWKAVKWIKKNNRYDIAKTGWKFFKNKLKK